MVRDVKPGLMSGIENSWGLFGIIPTLLANVNGTLYFAADDGVNGRELWRTDGTSAGTTLAVNLSPGPASSDIGTMANVNGTLAFAAQAGGSNGLWATDGTLAGTHFVHSGFVGNMTALESTLFFLGDHDADPEDAALWTSDLTGPGTGRVKNLSLRSDTSLYQPLLFAYEDKVYFTSNAPGQGFELWASDGTPAGTLMIADLAVGASGSSPEAITAAGGALYFSAKKSSPNHQIYRYEIASAAVRTVPLEPDYASTPWSLTAIGDRVFAGAWRSDVGEELFSFREDDTLPVVAAITSASANGVYTTGQSLNVTLTFSEPVTLNGTLSVTLDTGAILNVPSFTGTSVSVTYVVQTGHTSPDLTVTGLTVIGTLADEAGNAAALTLPASNLGVNANLIVNPPPPTTVTTFVVNSGSAQRSRVTQLEVTFSAPVSLASVGTIAVTRVGNPFVVDGSNGLVAAITGNVLTVTFTGLDSGSLPDGRWRLHLPGISYTSPEFHRFFGDVNGDGTVDGSTDFAAFGFRTAPNDPFDFNGDGTVDGPTDFSEFGPRFGRTV